jgi:hypothetical protein
MILKKLGTEYKLYGEDASCIATTQESPHKRLSKQNCDSLFGVVNVEKLASEYAKEANDISAKYGVKVFGDNNSTPFKDGFNKAMELNKDKLFTVEDVRKAMSIGLSIGYGRQFEIENKSVEIDSYIQSLQQPTEIEVEIEMEIVNTQFNPGATCIQDSTYISVTKKSKLDENGCLILKKK